MKTTQNLLATDELELLIDHLFAGAADLQVDHILVEQNELIVVVRSIQAQGICRLCGEQSSRVHSRYQRTLQDLPWSTFPVRLCLCVQRFFCSSACCPRRIFVERLPHLTEPSARRTTRLPDALLAVGWALGGEAGARLCRKQSMPICAATLLSLLRRIGSDEFPTPRVLGVDDWGFQQKQPSGTLLVDLEQYRPVDVLLGNDEEMLTHWLQDHDGVEVIVRDRGAGYRKAAAKGAPHAQQVLDRWHVLKNVGEVIQKTLAQQIDVLHQAGQQMKHSTQQTSCAPTEAANPAPRRRKPPRRQPPAVSPRRAWQMTMHQQVHELAKEGKTQAEIIRCLHLNPNTVRKYLRMPTFSAHYCCPRPSPVESYRAYLEERWQQGEVMIKTLWQEIQEQGYTGSDISVWTFVRPWPLPAGKAPTSSPPSEAASTRRGGSITKTPWQVKWILLHNPEELNTKDAAYRQALLCLSPPLVSLSALGQDASSHDPRAQK